MFSSKILSEIISGKQINALPKNFLTFSGFKTILHTVLFFLSLIYFSDLFFFLEEKSILPEALTGELEKCEIAGEGLLVFLLCCFISSPWKHKKSSHHKP